MTKKIIDAKQDSKGNITQVRFEGNSGFTSLDTAMRMADRGQIENAHTVRAKDKKPHLRTNPDRTKGNNLDEMAK
ncbi:hypothetical protein BBM40_22580 [Vibrio parahaemolyticus]|uniref:DUF3892 domain-containing protein n=1 Tax=Vibrio harveyi group TaxID=717610 RepID=UPI0003FCAC1B|nr:MULTISPECIES: DUF3892 domain-containing protein [Vibrio harveyi group]QLK46752.1 DUF3892 domain-containing protein [Vibrio owensii]EGQ9186083.1 DUF3892 domain-containing protein [Vibrio parahaemolyticus]EHE7894532.1 DUF3892 domain-containing protein [Vibrio parahaemolyticus]EHY8550668.1 DUF3892 domain-containing protein [Vibrio parahaemolyticus]EIA9327578.1 DUF3892 domain-containing protein [Vibrio parahaemolyticus]